MIRSMPVLVAMCLLGCLVGCNRTRAPLPLIIGTEPGRYPFAWLDPETQTYRGLEVELGSAIAREAGMTAEFRFLERGQLLAALRRQEISVVLSAIPIPAGASPLFAYSSPYLVGGMVIATGTGSSIGLPRHLAAHAVAVVSELGFDVVSRIEGMPRENIRQFADVSEAVAALEQGAVSAVVLGAIEAASATATLSTDVTIIVEAFTVECYGMVMRTGDQTLMDAIEHALARLRASGEHVALHQQWLGDMVWLTPGISGSRCTTLPYMNCNQNR